MLENLLQSFVEKIAQTKELCIMDAMSRGIDLHEMEIIEDISTDDNHIMKYTCRIRRRDDNPKERPTQGNATS